MMTVLSIITLCSRVYYGHVSSFVIVIPAIHTSCVFLAKAQYSSMSCKMPEGRIQLLPGGAHSFISHSLDSSVQRRERIHRSRHRSRVYILYTDSDLLGSFHRPRMSEVVPPFL